MDKNLRLQVILEGLDKLTAPLKSVTGAAGGARGELAKTREQLAKLNATSQQLGAFRKLKTDVGATKAEMEAARANANRLGQELAKTAEPTRKLQREFEKARGTAQQLEQRHQKQSAALGELRNKLGAAGVDTKNLAQHERQLRQQVGEANAALEKQTAQLNKLAQASRNSEKMRDISGKATTAGIGMIGAGMAAGVPVIKAIDQARSLETAMADVRKVVDFPTPEAFAQMSNDILDISTRIPMSADGIASIIASAGRANVPREELLAFAEDAAKMGVAFDTTAEQAGESMAKWRTAFGLPQAGVVALADQINALTNSYGGNVGAVSDMVTRIGPLGKVGGLAASEIASMAQVLSSVGVESEVGATGIKNMMLALTKGSAATKMQRKAFAALGLDAEKTAVAMQKDAGGAITDVLQRIQKLPKEAQAGVLTQLFGSESVAAIAPMLTSLEQLKENFALVGNSSRYAGSMNKEFLAATATTDGAVGLAKNGLQALNITMGQMLLPTVQKLAAFVGRAAAATRAWAQEHPVLAKGLMMFLGAGAALLVFLGGLALAFAALTAAAAPLGLALLPLFGIIAAIAAIAAAAYLIYAYWDDIVAYLGGIWDGICAAVRSAIGILIDLFMRFTPMGLLMRAFAPALAWLRGLDFAGIGRHMIQGLINGITGMLGALKSTITGAASQVAGWFRQKLGIHSPSRVFAALGGHVMAGLDQGLAAGVSAPLARIADLSGQMTRALAVGAGGAAMAITAPAAAQSAQTAGGGSAPAAVNYTINIDARGNSNPQDIAEAVRQALEKIERERRGRGFGDD